MRGSYSGNTWAFQAHAESSILLPRSMFRVISSAVESLPYTQFVGSSILSSPTIYARIAQSVEQRIENPRVGGSIPSPGTNVASGRNSAGFSKGSATKDFVVTQLALVV